MENIKKFCEVESRITIFSFEMHSEVVDRCGILGNIGKTRLNLFKKSNCYVFVDGKLRSEIENLEINSLHILTAENTCKLLERNFKVSHCRRLIRYTD